MTAPPEAIEVRLVGADEHDLLTAVAPGVFDAEVDARWAAEFLADPRHHLAVALADGVVVGIASAVHYVHPDKPPELWINEAGVAPDHLRKGLATRLLRALFEEGAGLGCTVAWVLTEPDNGPANALYRSVGGRREESVLYEFPIATPS